MTQALQVNLGFVGGGQMARGIIGGLLARGMPAARIVVGEPHAETAAALTRDFGVRAAADNAAVLRHADVLVLAVKPQGMAEVTRSLRHELDARPRLVISIAAGIRAADLQRWCGPRAAVVRAMPNRPSLVGAGATGLYAGDDVSAAQRAVAGELLGAVGLAEWVADEAQLDLVTALSGSGPAYFFLLAELMAQSATRAGLAVDVARRLAAQTLNGAGRMAGPDADLAALRASVTSKGGTTAAALAAFDAGGLAALVTGAMDAAARRSRELAALTDTTTTSSGGPAPAG